LPNCPPIFAKCVRFASENFSWHQNLTSIASSIGHAAQSCPRNDQKLCSAPFPTHVPGQHFTAFKHPAHTSRVAAEISMCMVAPSFSARGINSLAVIADGKQSLAGSGFALLRVPLKSVQDAALCRYQGQTSGGAPAEGEHAGLRPAPRS
jgi:hypothetical protein